MKKQFHIAWRSNHDPEHWETVETDNFDLDEAGNLKIFGDLLKKDQMGGNNFPFKSMRFIAANQIAEVKVRFQGEPPVIIQPNNGAIAHPN